MENSLVLATFDSFSRALAAGIHEDVFLRPHESTAEHQCISSMFWFINFLNTFKDLARRHPAVHILPILIAFLPYPDQESPSFLHFALMLSKRFQHLPTPTPEEIRRLSRPVVDFAVAKIIATVLKKFSSSGVGHVQEETGLLVLERARLNVTSYANDSASAGKWLLDEYKTKAANEWWRVIGFLSRTLGPTVIATFQRPLRLVLERLQKRKKSSKTTLGDIKNDIHAAVSYLNALQYLNVDASYIDGERQEDACGDSDHLENDAKVKLRDTSSGEGWPQPGQLGVFKLYIGLLRLLCRKSPVEIWEMLFVCILNALLQADFSQKLVYGDLNLTEIYWAAFNMASIRKPGAAFNVSGGRVIKPICQKVMAVFLLRAPEDFFVSRFELFLEKRLRNLTDWRKLNYTVEILRLIVGGVDNPFPFTSNELPLIRDFRRNKNEDYSAIIFRAIHRKKAQAILYESMICRKGIVDVLLIMCSRNLDFARTVIFPALLHPTKTCISGNGLGLELLYRTLDPTGEFCRKVKPLETECYNLIEHVEAPIWLHELLGVLECSVGVSKWNRKRSSILLLSLEENIEDMKDCSVNHPGPLTLKDIFDKNQRRMRMRYERFIVDDEKATTSSSTPNLTLNDKQPNSTQRKCLSKFENWDVRLESFRSAILCVSFVNLQEIKDEEDQRRKDEMMLLLVSNLLYPCWEIAQTVSQTMQRLVSARPKLVAFLLDQVIKLLGEQGLASGDSVTTLLRVCGSLIHAWSAGICRKMPNEENVERVLATLCEPEALALAYICHSSQMVRHGAISLALAVDTAWKRLKEFRELDAFSDRVTLYSVLTDPDHRLLSKAHLDFVRHQDNLEILFTFEEMEQGSLFDFPDPRKENNFLKSILSPKKKLPLSASLAALTETLAESKCSGIQKFCKKAVDYLRKTITFNISDCTIGSQCLSLFARFSMPKDGDAEDPVVQAEWVWQIYQFTSGSAIVNTVLFAMGRAHRSRAFNILRGVLEWFEEKQVETTKTSKKKKIWKHEKENSMRFRFLVTILLACTARLKEDPVDTEESGSVLQLLLNWLCLTCRQRAKILRWCKGDSQPFRDICRLTENVAFVVAAWSCDLNKKSMDLVWGPNQRLELLRELKLWSDCRYVEKGKELSDVFLQNPDPKGLKKEDLVAFQRKAFDDLKRMEKQAYRAAAAMLRMEWLFKSPALVHASEPAIRSEEWQNWFDWAFRGQQMHGVPCLKYFLTTHYDRLLPRTLDLFYDCRTKGEDAEADLLFDVILDLTLPKIDVIKERQINVIEVVTKLVVFCLFHMYPTSESTSVEILEDLAPPRIVGLNYNKWRKDSMPRVLGLFYEIALKFARGHVLEQVHACRVGLLNSVVQECVDNSAYQFSNLVAQLFQGRKSDFIPGILGELVKTISKHFDGYLENRDNLDKMGRLIQTLEMFVSWFKPLGPWFKSCPLHRLPCHRLPGQKDNTGENWRDEFLDELLYVTTQILEEDYKLQLPQTKQLSKLVLSLWKTLITSSNTLIEDPVGKNVSVIVRFLLRRVVKQYELSAVHKADKSTNSLSFSPTADGLSTRSNSIKITSGVDDEKELEAKILVKNITPTKYQVYCQKILSTLCCQSALHLTESVNQVLGIGCGLGGPEHDPVAQYNLSTCSIFNDGVRDMVAINIAASWAGDLLTSCFHESSLPVLLLHVFLFIDEIVEHPIDTGKPLLNSCFSLIGDLFSVLVFSETRGRFDDEVLQVAKALRNGVFEIRWNPSVSYNPPLFKRGLLDFLPYLKSGRKDSPCFHYIYVRDLVQIFKMACSKRYRMLLPEWGKLTLQWANIEPPKDASERVEERCRRLACKALQIFRIINEPKTPQTIVEIIRATRKGLENMKFRWRDYPLEERYVESDVGFLWAASGVEALLHLTNSFKGDWDRCCFRCFSALLWTAAALLRCRVAKLLELSRRLLLAVLTYSRFFKYMELFKESFDPYQRIAQASVEERRNRSAHQFWVGCAEWKPRPFCGLQSRLLEGLVHCVGCSDQEVDGLNETLLNAMARFWILPCKILVDTVGSKIVSHKSDSRREVVNLIWFLPYFQANLTAKEPTRRREAQSLCFLLTNSIRQSKRYHNCYLPVSEALLDIATKPCGVLTQKQVRSALRSVCHHMITMHFPQQAPTVAQALDTCLQIGNFRLKIATMKIMIEFLEKISEEYVVGHKRMMTQLSRVFYSALKKCFEALGSHNPQLSAAARVFVIKFDTLGFSLDSESSALSSTMHEVFRIKRDNDGLIECIDDLKVLSRSYEANLVSWANQEHTLRINSVEITGNEFEPLLGAQDRHQYTDVEKREEGVPIPRRTTDYNKVSPDTVDEAFASGRLSETVRRKSKVKDPNDKLVGIGNWMAKPGTLNTFLDDASLWNVFEDFLASRNQKRALNFYHATRSFKKLIRMNLPVSDQREAAKTIIETYLLPDSPDFLPELAEITRREALNDYVDNISPTLFDRSALEAKDLLIGIFPEFQKSEPYKELIERQEISPFQPYKQTA